MNDRTITSPHNTRIKDAARLRVGRQRQKHNRVLIDGAREIARALDGNVRLIDVFACDELCQSEECRRLLERVADMNCTLWHVSPDVFERLAFGERAEGVVAVAVTPERSLDSLQVPDGGLVAIACGLEKPGNVGAILRSADAAGVSAVIVADGGTDLFNPNCIRASLGTVFTQQVATATSGEAHRWLADRGYRILAARLDEGEAYDKVDYRGNVALVLGSEAAGLSGVWTAPEIRGVRLPMLGRADSLNVSAAAAVLFYEALRQRTAGP